MMKQVRNELMENLAVVNHITLWLILPLVSLWLPIYILICTRFWWAICLYFAWYCYDFNTPAQGSRNWTGYRNWSMWKHFVNYFPIKLHKTVDLSPEHNYILGCHPHGILSIGAFAHLCTSATGFEEKFPGLQSHIVTLTGQFWFPFRREFGIAMAAVDSSRKSLAFMLGNSPKGRLLGIVLGGAEEALDAKPGNYDLNILSRRGFCKLALQHGAHLVPSYSFGENDVFCQKHNERGSGLRKIQSFIKKKAGFCPPLFFGRGIISERFGILPFRRPINTVIGSPIQVHCFENPTQLQIEALHARYCVALNELFETHKQKYGVSWNTHLKFH